MDLPHERRKAIAALESVDTSGAGHWKGGDTERPIRRRFTP
jgi:hypothetical protein